MKKENYEATVTANVSAKDAFSAIGHPSEWWSSDVEGPSRKVNDVFTVRFGETFVTFKVTDVVPDKKVVWHVTDCHLSWINDKKEWKDTDLIFDLSPKGKSTQVRFTHTGLVPGIECYNDCSTGWDHYILKSLLRLMTEGKGILEKN